MAISIDKQLGIHQYALQLRSERAGILANNLANADTPGYKARDMDFGEVLKSQMGESTSLIPVQTTSAGHQQTLLQADTVNGLKYRLPSQPSIDGNTVDSEKEKSEFAQNTMEYQAAFEFLNGKIKSLLTAIKGE
ncbi:MAG TPA: flagellar basal body rod protein FlgB [Dongiaceae bacterium]|nr:flagellar basal body rod protein FlgB [Dongiaceae bacterium]